MKRLNLYLPALLGCLWLAGCNNRTTPASPGPEAGMSKELGLNLEAGSSHDGGKAKILDEKHAGWKQAPCATCHNLPEKNHSATQPAQCAVCHGGNGACDPNGINSKKRDHLKTAACQSCHAKAHGFAATVSCASCHFAAAGVVACGGKPDAGPPLTDTGPLPDGLSGPPVLSKNLKTSCLNWPAQPFSPTNKTGWKTSVSAGQLAIDFTLKDTAGKSYTLSDLLASGPVWLQLGSYT